MPIQKKYTSIGINYFPAYFPLVDYWMFLDSQFVDLGLAQNYRNQKILTCIDSKADLDRVGLKPYHLFGVALRDKPLLKDDRNLLGTCSSALPAIHYAWVNGAEEVILVGVRLLPEWGHFYDKEKHIKSGCDIFPEYINILKEHINIKTTDRLTIGGLELIDIRTL